MPPAGFELTISEGQPPHNYALVRVATGTGTYVLIYIHHTDIARIHAYIFTYIYTLTHIT